MESCRWCADRSAPLRRRPLQRSPFPSRGRTAFGFIAFFWQCTWAHAYVTRHSSLPGRLLGRPLGRFSVGPSVAPRVLLGRSLVGSSAGSCPCRLRLQRRAPPRRPRSRRRRRLRPRCVNARRLKAASAPPSTAALRRHCELARVPLD